MPIGYLCYLTIILLKIKTYNLEIDLILFLYKLNFLNQKSLCKYQLNKCLNNAIDLANEIEFIYSIEITNKFSKSIIIKEKKRAA